MDNELRKTEVCPKCGGVAIKRIIHGRPNATGMELIETGKAVLGDCFMRKWKEDWYCSECDYKWCDKTDPARVELEEFFNKRTKKL